MRFYQRLNAPRGLAAGYVALLDAMDAYAARAAVATLPAERAVLLAKREQVRQILTRMWKEYEKLGVDGAIKADELIRARIRATAVRPPTSGRLESGIISRPLPTTWPAGAVGIADIDALDKAAVNPRFHAAGPYWRTQEYGYAGHVGRRVPGYFQPGGARPSGAEFRVHPYFEQVGGAGGRAPRGTPAMVIRKPIEARHFLRDGTDDMLAWRQLGISRINRNAISALARI